MYGYVMPVLVAIAFMSNSFIVLVLSQKHLRSVFVPMHLRYVFRTPTNLVLLSMAVTDLLTGKDTWLMICCCTIIKYDVFLHTFRSNQHALVGLINFRLCQTLLQHYVAGLCGITVFKAISSIKVSVCHRFGVTHSVYYHNRYQMYFIHRLFG
jgi:hypothetical protein